MSAPSPEVLTFPLPKLRAFLASHYCRLSHASRRLRFLAPIADEGISRFTDAAEPDVVLGIGVDGEIRGVLEIFSTQEEGHAEIGLSVQDAYQGRGYGRQLFKQGILEARSRDFTSVDVHFSHFNSAIEKLCRDEGATLVRHGGEVTALISLT